MVVPVDLSASGTCARPVTMAFLAGTEPKNTCGPARSTGPKLESAPEPGGDPVPPQSAKPRSESP